MECQEPKYGSHKIFIAALKREVEFCDACGEYICRDRRCSNPTCPVPIPDYPTGGFVAGQIE
jgi:hypothetical protein